MVSNIGTWMQRVAQDWLVLQLSDHSGVALGITTGLQFLPMLLLAPFAGTHRRPLLQAQGPHRHPGVHGRRRRRARRCSTSPASSQVWHVFVLRLLLGVGAACDAPARQSFVIEMVGRDDLPNAVGLNSASFNLGRVIGPALAGLLIVLIGTGPVFLINAASFVAVILALTRDAGRPT